MMDNYAYNQAILLASEKYLGMAEIPGAKHNQAIVDLFRRSGRPDIADDETAWCAVQHNAVLSDCGIPSPGALNAKSFLPWGVKVALEDFMPGDTLVFERGPRGSWQGHVGTGIKRDGGRFLVRGGNQKNRFGEDWYPINGDTLRLVGIRRWAPEIPEVSEDGRPTLRKGNKTRDPFVEVAQELLREHGFFLGRTDGLFGNVTEESTFAFQGAKGLDADGVIGPETWRELLETAPKPNRDITTPELRERGSRTIAGADVVTEQAKSVGRVTTVGAIGGGLWGSLASLGEAEARLSAAETALDKVTGLLATYWPLIPLLVVVWLVLNRERVMREAADLIRAARTDDARSGANDKL